jgi:hypothetical protein
MMPQYTLPAECHTSTAAAVGICPLLEVAKAADSALTSLGLWLTVADRAPAWGDRPLWATACRRLISSASTYTASPPHSTWIWLMSQSAICISRQRRGRCVRCGGLRTSFLRKVGPHRGSGACVCRGPEQPRRQHPNPYPTLEWWPNGSDLSPSFSTRIGWVGECHYTTSVSADTALQAGQVWLQANTPQRLTSRRVPGCSFR